MLKIHSQLNRALRYQAMLGAERAVGHFDDAAKDLVGPPNKTLYREPIKDRKVIPIGSPVTNLRMRRDDKTGSWIGFYATEEE